MYLDSQQKVLYVRRNNGKIEKMVGLIKEN